MEEVSTDFSLLPEDLGALLKILQDHGVSDYEFNGMKLKLSAKSSIETKKQLVHNDLKEEDDEAAALKAARLAKENENVNFGIWSNI